MSFLYRVTWLPDLTVPQLIAGDAIHCYRGAVDHMCWGLVGECGARQALSPKAAEAIQYPMAKNAASFDNQLLRRLPGVHARFVAIIKRYQPYRGTPEGRAIRLLRTLSNRDKHRLMIMSQVTPRGLNIEFVPTGCQITGVEMFPLRKALQVGTKVARVHFVPDPPDSPTANMQMKSAFVVFPSLGYGRGLPDTLDHLALTVRALLAEVEAAI